MSSIAPVMIEKRLNFKDFGGYLQAIQKVHTKLCAELAKKLSANTAPIM